MICFLTALSSAIGRPPWPGHVWPPVWITGAACTHAGSPASDPRYQRQDRRLRESPRGGWHVQQGAGPDDVVVHRGDQRGDVGEGGHGPQPRGELDADVLAV